MFSNNTKPLHYGGLGIDYKATGGGDDTHTLNGFYTVSSNSSNTTTMSFPGASAPDPDYGSRLDIDYADNDEYIYKYVEWSDKINEYFDTKFGNQMCFYIYEVANNDGNSSLGMKITKDRYKPDRYLSKVARIWFKSIDGWAIFSTPMEKTEYGNNPWNFIKKYLFKNYKTIIYCFSNSISCGEAHIATPDNTKYIYNNKYTLTSPLILNCTISGTTINVGNQINCENGTIIEFKKENGNNSLEKSINYNIEISSSEDF